MNETRESGAIATINKTLRIKDEIDRPFSLDSVNVDVKISENDEPEKKVYKLKYQLNNNYFGFNVISHLNLGRAYMLRNNEDGDKYEYNISPDAERVKFPSDERDVFNEKWIDYVFKTISSSRYSAVVLENIFTRVTTGNYEYYLPYQEQLRVIVKKIKEHKLENKIVALVRGSREMDIINSSLGAKGPDLMKMLGDALGLQDRVTGSRVVLEFKIKNPYNDNSVISLTNYNAIGRVSKGIFQKMISFIEKEPGFDIYWNSSAKIAGQADTFVYHDPANPKNSKPCTALFFGPMYYFDRLNKKREDLPPYAINHTWFKIQFDHAFVKGEDDSQQIKSTVRADFNDYNIPEEEKQDNSNFVSSVVSDLITESLDNLSKTGFENTISSIENMADKSRKELNLYMKKMSESQNIKSVKHNSTAIKKVGSNLDKGKE